MRTRTRKKRTSRKTLLISVVTIGVLAAGGGLFAYKLNSPQPQDEAAPQVVGPTAEEKVETERHKEEIANPEPQPEEESPDDKKLVTPIITGWGKNTTTNTLDFRGFVPEVVENGGTCTITLSRSGYNTITKSKTASENVSNTSCGLIAVPAGSLSPGTWQAVLSYSSDTAEGASGKVDIGVD